MMPDGFDTLLQHEADAANDAQLLRDVRTELEHLHERDAIRVTVQHAVAVLSGVLADEKTKEAALAAARRVAGVLDVQDDLCVALHSSDADEAILLRVRAMLALDAAVAPDRLITSVSDGDVTIGGHVEWPGQAKAALAAVRRVRGVKNVTSTIRVDGMPSLSSMRARLIAAFRDAGEAAAAQIDIAASARVIRLSGKARSSQDRALAEEVFRNLQGIDSVENCIAIE